MKSFEEILECENQLILRDKLATERTLLASRRTLLAYIRTAVSFFGCGIALVKIVENIGFITIGWIFMISSPAFLVAGIINYSETQRRIKKELNIVLEKTK